MARNKQKDKVDNASKAGLTDPSKTVKPVANTSRSKKSKPDQVKKELQPIQPAPTVQVMEVQAVIIPVQPVQPSIDAPEVTPVSEIETTPAHDIVIEETGSDFISITFENAAALIKFYNTLSAETSKINSVLIDSFKQSIFINYDILKINQSYFIDLLRCAANPITDKTDKSD
ncbi:MAG: hypothetical protein HQL06_07960 [Nitrospirae bacterium]|nr:hypothetical protein [Nitrospirota bacterium]